MVLEDKLAFKPDWPAFFDAMVDDEPIPEMVLLCQTLLSAHIANQRHNPTIVFCHRSPRQSLGSNKPMARG